MQANEEFVILRTFLASHSTQESSKLYLNDDKYRYVTKLDHHMGKISKYMNQILSQRRDLKSSVSQFSHSVLSEYLWPHWLQNIRLPCPSPTPGAYTNSYSSSWWCHPTISSSALPFSSCLQISQHQGIFQWVSCSHQVVKVLEFQLQHQSFREYWGLISFSTDWFDHLAVQGTRKSFLQHHSSKASILRCSAFFTVQLSHPYMTTGKTIALTTWTFVGKVMFLCFLICCLGWP